MSPTSYFHGDKKIAHFKSAEAGGQETVLTISPLDFVNFAQTGGSGSGDFAIPR